MINNKEVSFLYCSECLAIGTLEIEGIRKSPKGKGFLLCSHCCPDQSAVLEHSAAVEFAGFGILTDGRVFMSTNAYRILKKEKLVFNGWKTGLVQSLEDTIIDIKYHLKNQRQNELPPLIPSNRAKFHPPTFMANDTSMPVKRFAQPPSFGAMKK